MDPEVPYAPPLTLTPALLSQVAGIAEALGHWSARQDSQPSPRLRRENRIHTIQASLAIEQNSLNLEQVSALFDGQRVIGPARDIQEVRNAIAAYEALARWNPTDRAHLLEAHGLLMAGLIDAPGRFRSGGVGICWGDQLVHMAPPASRVSGLVDDLLKWLATSDWHPLLAWLPIEEVIRSRQQAYYESLGQADQQGDLQPFVTYQLEAIHEALRSEIDAVILRDLAAEPTLSARRLAERLQLSQRAVEKHLAALQKKGRLLRHGSPRAGSWQVL